MFPYVEMNGKVERSGKVILHEEEIWCESHACVHEPVTNPYDGLPHKDEDGKDVWLHHVDLDEDGNETRLCLGSKPSVRTEIRPMDPDCNPEDWKVLWIGRNYK